MTGTGKRRVSVIVPVYNAGRWLRPCVESICAQSYEELEILLLDDGSSDDSPEICREMEREDSRIRVVSKANTGVSDTRNLGIQLAAGDYITFVDADDYLRKDILEKAVDCMEQNHAQLCVWNVACVKEDAVKKEPSMQTGMISPQSAATAVIYDSCADVPLGRYFRASWGKLYCATLLKERHVVFPVQQKIGEDALFLLDYIRHAERIVGIDEAGYYYRITDVSAVRRYRTDLPEQYRMQLDFIAAYAKQNPAFDCVQTRTAQTCLAWDMFRRLIRNSLVGEKTNRTASDAVNSEAGRWFVENSSVLRAKGIAADLMPKTTRLQYLLSGLVPLRLLLQLSTRLEKQKL